MAAEKKNYSGDKVLFEYELSSRSVPTVWESISTPPGLSSWFADSVVSHGRIFAFRWGKSETREAELTSSRQNTYVRFHWTDSEPGTFFEIRILKNALTGAVSLAITDFDVSGDDDLKDLWDSSIDALRRCGL